MSDKNIDKDIRTVKNDMWLIEEAFEEIHLKRIANKKIQALKKVVSEAERLQDVNKAMDAVIEGQNRAIKVLRKELEKYKRIANMNLKDSEEFNKNMCEHRCPIKSDYEEVKQELETYKKIAENLLEVSDEEKAEAYFQEYIGKNNDDYDEFEYFFEKARKEAEK